MIVEALWFLAEVGFELMTRDVCDGSGRGRRPNLGALILIPVLLIGFVYVLWSLLPEHPWMVTGILGGAGAIAMLLWLGRHKPRRRRRYRGHMPGDASSEP